MYVCCAYTSATWRIFIGLAWSYVCNVRLGALSRGAAYVVCICCGVLRLDLEYVISFEFVWVGVTWRQVGYGVHVCFFWFYVFVKVCRALRM